MQDSLNINYVLLINARNNPYGMFFFICIYDNKIVFKPWGYEYVVYRNANHLSVTLLNINYNKTTSLHCHPLKKSGFILLGGKALFQLGLRKKNTELHSSPSKRMIARGLFHSIKSISKNGLLALEFETPVNKNDLVRFKDSYGREKKSYEGKKFTKAIESKFIKMTPYPNNFLCYISTLYKISDLLYQTILI